MKDQFQTFMITAICILTAWNVGRFVLNVSFIRDLENARWAFLSDKNGLPRDIPLRVQDAVMVFEPTDHYDVHDVNAWESLSPGLNGWAKVKYGEKDEPFALAMFHRLHCLNFMRYDLTQSKKGVKPTESVIEHENHCYNFVRESLLCGSDITMEPRIVEQLACENPSPPSSVPHVCKNWVDIHNFIKHNYESNLDFFAKGL
ncbi:hypothetical protein EST38_g7902 [Candolleomyces aberdarensis]|uniref:Oxidase ustYa n=1 Tax=Candolleomyces aberdarensis TaxID=2316362 RepID=A0A4Q2DEI8_9AGAR|nr:hypothetical protein EST38_g7902 [Candolleomyces aberdarensis]